MALNFPAFVANPLVGFQRKKQIVLTNHEELELEIITDKSKSELEDKLKKRETLSLPEYELQDILEEEPP
ncbi:hypothetical protein DRP04_11795 [Archaeoglobales archaeon]|nr:MAG: hypothetical protein DRP04_11795 [Archaeoglobales archaeon]